MPKQIIQYEHCDQLNQPLTVDAVVAFCFAGGNQVHIGRVVRLTARRVRIAYTSEYTNHAGEQVKWTTTYQAHPDRVLILNGVEQQLTLLALKGVI
jgi:hypothetical protein